MKPTLSEPKIANAHRDIPGPASPVRRFPATDYFFQTAIEEDVGVGQTTLVAPAAKAPAASENGSEAGQLPALWKISREFIAGESRNRVVETVLFALVSAICAWPIAFAVYSAARLARGY